MDVPRKGQTTVTDLPGDRWLVSLAGDHDLSTADDLRDKLRAIFCTGTTVVVDLSGATFIDSSTLGVLMRAGQYAEEQRCDHFALVAPRDGVADRLFVLAGVRRVFTTFETVEAALAELDAATPDDAATAERWRERKQRIVKNEQAFRDYNDRRLAHEAVAATDDVEPIPFVCECGDESCIQALLITAAQFTEAHSAPNRFLVRPGHVYPDVERIVEEHESFAIVEKSPAAVREAS